MELVNVDVHNHVWDMVAITTSTKQQQDVRDIISIRIYEPLATKIGRQVLVEMIEIMRTQHGIS